MLLTPQEAAKRECRALPPIDDPVLGSASPNCIASRCMAWRWQALRRDAAFEAAVEKVKTIDRVYPHEAAVRRVMENRSAYGLPTVPTHGFCGLAGKPDTA